jgi:hypothetical protein
MKRIYKTFWGQYIDLKRLVSVSNAHLVDNENEYSCHKQVCLNMFFDRTETPVVYRRNLVFDPSDDCKNFETEEALYTYCSGGWYTQDPKKNEQGEYIAVVNLQKQIDSLIQDWKEYINNPE